MNLFNKKYVTYCDSEFLSLGFKRKRSTYFRIANNVLQFFSLKSWGNGHLHTIEFESKPFCCGIVKNWEISGKYDMERFDIQPQIGAWFCDPLNESSIGVCIHQLITNIKLFVIPFFDRTLDVVSAFYESISLEKLFDENRKKYLMSLGKENRAFLGSVNLYDRDKFYMALKIGNYEFAQVNSELNLDCAIKAYEESKDFITENNRIARENDIKTLKKEIYFLENHEYNYFKNLLVEKENISNKTLEKYL